MSTIDVNGSSLGNAFNQILTANDIQIGDSPSYELCKLIYLYHPLGAKMAEAPITMAQSQTRDIDVEKGPKERLAQAFEEEWKQIGADKYILNTRALSRVYGASAISCLVDGEDSAEPIDFEKLYGAKISFNVFDPLNVAGSLVLNQIPNAIDFLKTTTIVVQGQRYHSSRSRICLNEQPIYLGYTTSAFGYVGRSIYQRSLFPLKSFVQSMRTDDMVTRKAGLLVAMMQQAGSIIDNVWATLAGIKRTVLQQAQTDNVISIGTEEKIETLNMQNLDGAYGMARKNILENIAVSADMPAKLLNAETFAEGFGEGSEDAKNVARYIDRERIAMEPLYSFFDEVVMHRAWNKDFYENLQEELPEYKKIDYKVAFQDWQNSFRATWPSLLTEPDSEKSKAEKVKMEAIVSAFEILFPAIDPENKVRLIEHMVDNMNELEFLFSTPLILDTETMLEHLEEMKQNEADMQEAALAEPKPGQPQGVTSKGDSDRRYSLGAAQYGVVPKFKTLLAGRQ